MRRFIFAWFVGSVFLMAVVSFVGVLWTGPYLLLATWSFYGSDLVEYAAQNEAIAYEAGGAEGVAAFEQRVSPHGRVRAFLFDENFREVSGRVPSDRVLALAHQLRAGGAMQSERDGRGLLAGSLVEDSKGRKYRLVLVFSFRPGNLPGGPKGWAWGWTLRIAMVLVCAALLCSWLAWRLSAPLGRLREATRKFAAGDLSARARPDSFPRNPPEYAALAGDFDEMAHRIELLVNAQRQLLQDVSHELRTPLTRLGLAVNVARKQPQGAAQLFDRIDQESERLNGLIERIIRLSRIEAMESPRRDLIEVSDFLESIVADANFEAEATGRKVKLLRCEEYHLRGDRELLREAMENVIRNAIRFTPEGSSVRVDAFLNGPSYEVVVSDEGPGVSEDHLAAIFEPFHRAPQQAETTGFGLGLAIAKRAVDLHRGRIEGRNRAAGGFEICVMLPVS